MHGSKRIQKKMNDYILTNYSKLFFDGLQVEDMKISVQDIISNQTLVTKVKDELKFCSDQEITAEELIRRCVVELQKFGFLNTMEGKAEEHVYKIRDMKEVLKKFLMEELQKPGNETGVNFDRLYKMQSQKY